MKLRTRLYLWISGLFILFFVVAYFVEVYLVNSHLHKTEMAMEKKINEVSEKKREDYEEFLGIQLADMQATVDALLYRINEFSYLKTGFSPSQENIKGKTWSAAASLLMHYKWINFIQNSIDGNLTSLLIPSAQDLHPISYHKISDDLFWVLLQKKGHPPYLALRLSLEDLSGLTSSLIDLDVGKFTNIFFFFDWKTIANFSPHAPLALEGLSSSDISKDASKIAVLKAAVEKKLLEAKEYLNTLPEGKLNTLTDQEFRKLIDEKYPTATYIDGHEENIPFSIVEKGEKGKSDIIDMEFIRTFNSTRNRDDAVVLTWALSTAFSTDLFGTDPLGPKAPLGVAIILPGKQIGSAILGKGTFYNKPLYNEIAYVEAHNQDLPESSIPASMALIDYPEDKELFIGNTLTIEENGSKSILTIAVKISELMQQVSLASNQTVALVNDRKVISVFNNEGESQKNSPFLNLPLEQMQEKKGSVIVGGKKYYFLHTQPFEKIDLHFYLFELESKAFALVTFIKDNLSDVIEQISLNMRLIAVVVMILALIVLELIARKITKPITRLVKATYAISEGHYEDVDLPHPKNGKKDEISILCESFSSMIQGLKDREKVKGVLNKVVSKEIAEEILKGNVSLGGEKKQATIVFADIRNFTELTEKMDPQDVIALLNNCMTKISNEVDEFGGVIDKYVGDEAMALYGAPITQEDHAKRACLSALQMIEKVEEWNIERKKNDEPAVHIGIGICTGEVVAGNMGAENRLNYTVLGSNVNLGARLCSKAKPKEILVTKNTVESPGVKDMIEYTEMEAAEIKGFSEPVRVFKITGLKK